MDKPSIYVTRILMWQHRTISILFLLSSLLSTQTSVANPQKLSLPELEQRLEDTDTELQQLAHYSMRSGIGSLGYRSVTHDSPHHTEWIEIKLAEETPLDEIILTPTIRRDTHDGFQADGLPVEFRIIVGTDQDREGVIVSEYSFKEYTHSRIKPIIFQTYGVKASWVRIEAQELSKRSFDGNYLFQLSEVMIFNGETNVALRRPVKTSSTPRLQGRAWDKRFLVDGHTPYLMDAAHGLQSIGFISKIVSLPTLHLDLGEPTSLNRIHMHTLDQSDMIPQSQAGDLGIPDHLLITGSSSPDFSDAVTLLDFHKESIQNTGPIMMWNIPETTCRYIKISSIDAPPNSRLGFAEIEFFSSDENVALGKDFLIADPIYLRQGVRKLSALTDGRNFYGDLLPIRKWLNELARRHELEAERPVIAAALQGHYTRQKENLTMMRWLAALLAAGVIIIVLITRILRQRAVTHTRERIAANLHDELGANLHAIGLFGDLAKQEVNETGKDGQWDQLVQYVDEIRSLTEHTGKTARYCANMLEARELYSNLVEDMKRLAEQLRADLEHEITFENEEMLQSLPPRKRIGVFLFYKECITNIIRHSAATRVETSLIANNKEALLTVYDNGKGVIKPPSSLKRRARLLKSKLTLENPKFGGTKIILRIVF
ncbi:MAG: ATP-binding protein [Akkermansiaceae bacterium]